MLIYELISYLLQTRDWQGQGMDIKLLVLVLTAICCGSIKNSIEQPQPFQNILAKEIRNEKTANKHKHAYHVEKYKKFLDDSSINYGDKGKYTNHMNVTVQ